MDSKDKISLNLNLDKESKMEENNSFDFQSGELIAAYIVDKLVSYTITKSDMKEIEKKLGNHCFDFVREMLSNMVKMDSLSYDREDYNIELNKLKEEEPIFFDTTYDGVNDWNSIYEPRKTKIDRSATTLIKIQKNLNDKKELEGLTVNNLINNLQKDNSKNTNVLRKSNKILESLNVKKDLLNTETINPPTSPNNAPEKVVTTIEDPEFLNFKLDHIKEYYEDPEIKLVREEREREWKRQEEENKKKMILEQVKLEILKNEQKLKSKELDGRKVTFDNNGILVNIKGVNMEKLNNDFMLPRFEIKDTFNISNSNINIIRSIKPDTPKDKSSGKEETKKNDRKGKMNESQTSEGQVIPGFNKDDKSQKGKDDDKVIMPAGSSFDLLVPETGVTMIEDGKTKAGEKDYFSKYKKYSIYDYTNILRDALSNSLNKTIKKGKEKKIEGISNISNISSNLPNINYNQSVDFTGRSLNSFEGILDPMRMKNPNGSIKNPEQIKLTSKASLSLRNSLDTLDLIPELEEKINLPQRNVDIFKLASNRLKLKNIKPPSNLEDINQFNLDIIQNNKWGGEESLGKKNRPIILPPKSSLMQKLGNNAANTKKQLRQRVINTLGDPKK